MLEAWVSRLAALGLWGVGLLFVIEGAGLPLPAEIPFVLSGALAHAGRYPFWLLVLLAWVTTVIGNFAGYGVGYLGGRRLVERMSSWAGVSASRLERLESWFHRHGLRVLFFTRWINWGFGQSLWLAGLARVPLRRFAPFMLVLNLAWAILWIGLGVSLAGLLGRLGVGRGGLVLSVLVAVVVVVGTYFVHRGLRSRKALPE